jgi:WD40 repeat protein
MGKKQSDGMRLKLWNYPKGTHRKTSKQAIGGAVRIAFSPDGTLIATNDERRRVRLWDANTLAPVGEYTPLLKPKKKSKFDEPVHCFAFHPSGRYLAVAGQAGPVEFVDTTTWKPVVAFDWKHGRTYGVCFSSDGTLAAAGSEKGQIVVWDVDL